MNFNMILATDENFGIGIHDVESATFDLPWDSRKFAMDMKHFNNVTRFSDDPTKQNAVIMGRHTWLSIPESLRPLKDRFNIVITSNPLSITSSKDSTNINNFVCTETSLNSALTLLSKRTDIADVFVIGGARLYEESIYNPNFKYMYLTKIHKNFECNVKVNIDFTNLKLISSSFVENEDGVLVEFTKYENVHPEIQYLQIMKKILEQGGTKNPRNGLTKSIFIEHMEFDMSTGLLPVLTTKRVFIRGVFEELMFFLRGDTNTNHLSEKGVKIWNDNTSREFLDSVGLTHYEVGDIGTAYSFQFRHYGAEYTGMNTSYEGKGVDQFQNIVNMLIENRFSRRILMTTYNPSQTHLGPLPPCHGIVIHFNVQDDNKLSLHMYQRSADWFLGVPWNITSYALMLLIVIELVNNNPKYTGPKLVPSKVGMSFGDAHLYDCHYDAAKLQTERSLYPLPTVKILKPIVDIDELEFTDIKIEGYKTHPNDFKVKMIA